MANTLEFSEENAFDPLLLMDDLVDAAIDESDIMATIDASDEDIDSNEETETSSASKIPSPIRHKVQEQCEDLPPFQLNQETLFRELIDQHQRRLYRFVIKYIDHPDDAADITQQAFVEAARTISSFRGDSKLSTWLFGIAMNMVRNYLSRAPHRVYKFETDEVLGSVIGSEPDPSDTLEQKQILALVQTAFSDLPDEMGQALSLVAIDEISYQDAADILSIPLGTVRSRVSRARAVLRTHFQQAGISMKF